MHLTNFDSDVFLRDTWQKRPLLIRNAWDAWHNPLEPDELAGLACEDGAESRLIVQKRGGWKVEHGPLPETRFRKLGKRPWTLLVQAVDHLVPDVAALIDPFRFIPNWRIDDVMVSYASDGGGVGPHFDQYDVFLIQGLGRRRWQIGGLCDAATPLLPHDDLRLLAEFEATEEWVLEPGDMLYVPPGFAHNGIAVGDDCMTYSIGFRAPSRSELIAHCCDHLLSEIAEDDRYADPHLAAQDNPGEICARDLASLHAMITDKMMDRDAFARWFGEYNTTPKYADQDFAPEVAETTGTITARVAAGVPLIRNPASRFSFVRGRADAVTLFVDGASFDAAGGAARFAETLGASARIIVEPALMKDAAPLIARLIDQGSLMFDLDD
ncbi:JmjC domain-containing protein [Sphingomonas antarctica]|uniref:JmjC domain-containing protein n=1 Tax=Sphingomonas antarctica TaxID=2040274 RepID=UPI0039EC51D7